MSIPIEKLVTDLGQSLQRANKFVEIATVDMYFKAGYKGNSTSGDETVSYTPIMYEVAFPETDDNNTDKSGETGKKITIPVSALINNTSMRIESAEITMKFTLEETEDGVAAILHSDKTENPYALSQMTVKFQNTPSTEAIARVTQEQFRNKI
jgi:hypothetical protein